MPIDIGLGNGYLICHVRRDTGDDYDYCIVKGKRLDNENGKSLQDTCDKHGAKLSPLYAPLVGDDQREQEHQKVREQMALDYQE